MIYGINFNRTAIPAGYAKKFAAAKRFRPNEAKVTPDANRQTDRLTIIARLQGVAESPSERDLMLIQADNRHRYIFTVERKTAGPTLYGVYI